MSIYTTPVRLILDFDGTLTRKDTLHLVAKAGYDRQRENGQSREIVPWNEIVKAYMKDYNAHTDTFQPTKAERTSLASEVRWLNSLKPVEKASAERVFRAGIFDDVSAQDLETAARVAIDKDEMVFRPGWTNLITSINNLNLSTLGADSPTELLHVLSVNWSRWFIWSALHHASGTHETSPLLTQLGIYANEVPSVATTSNLASSEAFVPKGYTSELQVSGDKVALLQELQATYSDRSALSIYIGDSATDLECLLAVDVGICIRDEPLSSGQRELAETCQRVGIPVEHISRFGEVELPSDKSRLKLRWAKDFLEVSEWLEAQ